MRNRDLVFVLIMLTITFGLYGIYWLVKTKGELVGMGADVPTSLLIIIPFGNVYYLYKWSMGAAKVAKEEDIFGLVLFLLYLVFAPAAIVIAQDKFNSIKGAGRKR
jgi:hypothetical protein